MKNKPKATAIGPETKLGTVWVIASKIPEINSINRATGVNLVQIAKPKKVKTTPTALITNQRLTNNPGDNHLNHRLNCLGVRLLTLANLPLLSLNRRKACLNGLVAMVSDPVLAIWLWDNADKGKR